MKLFYWVSLAGLLMPLMAPAAEVTQRVGGYRSTNGETRAEGALGGSIERGPYNATGISSASYTLDASVEKIRTEFQTSDKYMAEHFPLGSRLQRSASIGATHTVRKLTDIRVGGGLTSDLVTNSRSVSGGVGHWWFQESIQTNIDFSRTITDRPPAYILDYDAETILLAPNVASGGVTASFKHLATPTTVWGGSYTRVEATARPRLDAYGTLIKQYIPVLAAAVHGSMTRIINTGPVTTETTSGSLAGIQAEVAFLKTLWRGASGRASYRYAREDEHTRAFGDHLLFGADSYTIGLSQDLDKGVVIDRPVTANLVGTRYITNRGVSATMGEAGLSIKF